MEKEDIKPKIFKCENPKCEYEGIRWNNNKICKRCGKTGRLMKLIENETTNEKNRRN